MFRIECLILSIIICATLTDSARGPAGGRVINGNEVTDMSNYSYMLSLRRFYTHICGAAIISPDWAITAARCLTKTFPSQITLRGGSVNRNLGIEFTVDNIIVHPQFDGVNLENDAAVLHTTTPFGGANIAPIPLAIQGTFVPGGNLATFTGWGILSISESLIVDNLHAANIEVVSNENCMSSLTQDLGNVTQSNMCAGVGVQDFCMGDEGGPLVFGGRLVGIASWGPSCGDSQWPSIYTRISAVLIRSFIRQHTGL